MDWDDPEKVKEYYREYWYKRRAAVNTLLGGKCSSCGSTENLEFDHIDPEEKSFDIKRNLSLTNEAVRAELAKCQLLCELCHLEKTARENSGYTHGSIYTWMKKKCQCEICVAAKREWCDERNVKRRVVGGPRGPYGPRDNDPPHGSNKKYLRGCRCAPCKAGHTEKAREYKRKKALGRIVQR